MLPAVLFGDVVASAASYLQASLDARTEPYTDAVTVSTNYTGATAVRQVVLDRDGGPRINQVLERPRLRVRCWAATDSDATDLASMVMALLQAWPNGDPVVASRQLSGPSAVEEPNGRKLRYSLVELTVRGTQLTPA